jgi:ankyrin repeat protein
VAELLLTKGADINARNDDGWTPLHWAARNGCDQETEFLLGRNAAVDARDKDGNTPLHLARSPAVRAVLVAHGADVSAKNNDGWTPLQTVPSPPVQGGGRSAAPVRRP